MRIKLRDIAARANVSMATVSRVLNNNPNVDERTQAIVLQALKEIGYPLPEGRPQRGINKGIIVTIRSSLEKSQEIPGEERSSIQGFNSMVIDGIEVVANQAKIPLSILRVRLDEPDSNDLAQLLQADGVILIGGLVSSIVIDTLEEAGIPFVQAAARVSGREINSVEGDYLNSVTQAIHVLAGLGHRRIAYINGPHASTTSQDKLAGYKLGICEANIAYDPGLVLTADDFHPQSGYQATQELLQVTRDFSAVLYASDVLALGGIKALKEAELEIPENVSVMGLYDEPIAQFTDPPLSSVHIDWRRLGKVAALRLVALLERRDDERLRIILPMHPVLRDSTALAQLR